MPSGIMKLDDTWLHKINPMDTRSEKHLNLEIFFKKRIKRVARLFNTLEYTFLNTYLFRFAWMRQGHYQGLQDDPRE